MGLSIINQQIVLSTFLTTDVYRNERYIGKQEEEEVQQIFFLAISPFRINLP